MEEQEEIELFRLLRERAEQVWPDYEDLYGPLLDEELRESEEVLGFRLPGFVRRLYSHVGNGGFGPGYGGVLGLVAGATDDSELNAVDRYCGWREWQPDPEDYGVEIGDPVVPWEWPEGMLPVCHWGCAIYSCIDCTREEAPVLRFRHDCYDPTIAVTDLLVPESPSFAAWLQAWLRGTLNEWVPLPGRTK